MFQLWEKFKHDKLAVLGTISIFFLLFLAIYAPLIANERPLLVYNDNGLSFPFFKWLFMPEAPEKIIEKFFNFLFLITISWGILAIFFLKSKKIFYIVGCIISIITLLPFIFSQDKIEKINYREIYKNSHDFVIFAPIPYSPFETISSPYSKPSKKHILGTDSIGRSVASRIIYGARISLAVGLFATFLSLIIGTVVGLYIGYFKGKIDLFAMRLIEIINCFPTFLLLLILMAMFQDRKFDQSVIVIILVLGLTSWIGVALLVRGEVLKQSSLPYILSCKALGLSTYKTLFKHLLPNVLSVVLISFSFGVAGAILAESSLSFLGFGVQAPSSSWGNLLRQSFDDPLNYWHLTFFPGLALFIAVLGFNFVGEGIRNMLDSKNQ